MSGTNLFNCFPFGGQMSNQGNIEIQKNPFDFISFDDELSDLSPCFQYESENENYSITETITIRDQIIENNTNANLSFTESTNESTAKVTKRKIKLSKKAKLFKNAFYQIFTTKKRFPKKLVQKIHEFVSKFIPINKISRDQIRCIDLYFKEFACFSELIISFIQNNRLKILESIPELSEV